MEGEQMYEDKEGIRYTETELKFLRNKDDYVLVAVNNGKPLFMKR